MERANLTVFVDYGMRKGVESWTHVMATLRGARGVLLLLTGDFEESPWCLEEARAVAARLNAARAAGAQHDSVLPVFIDRETCWDEEKLAAAFNEFLEDRDFELLRSREPGLSADIVQHWREALDPVARTSYLTHSFEPTRRSEHAAYNYLLLACVNDVSGLFTQVSAACSQDVNIVDAVQAYFLDTLCPLLHPPVEHEVEMPGIVQHMRSQLLEYKVSISRRSLRSLCLSTYCRECSMRCP